MWTCPNCKTEVEAQFELCWACGTSRDGEDTPDFNPEVEGMMAADDYAAETEAKRREELVTLATFWNAPEAHVVRSRLEAEGITAVVTDELATTWGLANNLGSVKVEVPQTQLHSAREVLESLHASASMDERLIAKAVMEGIQIKPSPPIETPPVPVSLVLRFPYVIIWPVLFILVCLMITYMNWLM